MKKLLALLFGVSLPLCAVAQSNYVTITTTSGIVDASGTALPSGTFCAYATDATDSPIPFEVNGTFQAVKATVCRNIVSGTLATSLQLANPAVTQPLNIRYHITITNTLTHQVTQYPGVSIVTGGSSWDWSSWNPATGSTSIPINIQSNVGSSSNGQVLVNSGGSVGGVTTIPIAQGGTGATSAGAALTALGAVAASQTVNGHPLSAPVVVSASDLTTGTLPHAQLPALVSGDIPNNGANTSGTSGGLSANIAESQVTNLPTDLAAKVPQTTTVNGHALSSNVVVSASDLTTGTLPHGQLPALVSGDIPANAANTSGSAALLSAASALPNNTTATTQAAGDSSPKPATTAFVGLLTGTPAWLEYLGTGVDGANTTASGTLQGVKYYTNFTVPFGNTVTSGDAGLTVHATGACIIAGTINGRGADNGGLGAASGAFGLWGGPSGGSGGGVAGGTAGNRSFGGIAPSGLFSTGLPSYNGGSAGASSGGNGAAPTTVCSGRCTYTDFQRAALQGGASQDSLWFMGAGGQTGANSGGTGGLPGAHVTLICASITGTDGTHTGTIDVDGAFGNPSAANSTGAGGGGGGGVIILSSQATIATLPTMSVAAGPGGLVTVPEAVATGGSCTTQPKATLGVTAGALSGVCTVVTAGAGCGTGTGVTFNVVGGGGTLGTGTVNPTWSGGTLASCTTTAGTSSGYTASTFTTSGTGGDGAAGWTAVFQGW